MPGKVYAAVLPDDLSGFDEEHQLSLQVIRENMLKNHGYYKVTEDGVEQCLISCTMVYTVLHRRNQKNRTGQWKNWWMRQQVMLY